MRKIFFKKSHEKKKLAKENCVILQPILACHVHSMLLAVTRRIPTVGTMPSEAMPGLRRKSGGSENATDTLGKENMKGG